MDFVQFFRGGFGSGGIVGRLFMVDICDDVAIYVFYKDV